MATSLKTVEFWVETADCNDASDTNQPQITIYLPESSITFKSVIVETVFHDRSTTIGSITRRQLSLQLGAAGYSTVNNTNTLTNGGEQQTMIATGDFTSYFTSNWSGTSMTCDVRLLADTNSASPLTPNFVNLSTRIIITYEYDDTSSTQIKTVRIPLNCNVGTMDSSKPGSANDTIPALDTELPETSKSYRQQVLVIQGNDAGTSTDLTISCQVDTDTAFTSYSYEHGSNCNMFIRCNDIVTFTTNATHGFYIWGSAANFNHFQAWLVVTYEFAASSTTVFNSVMLPLDFNGSEMGGATSSDYQRGVATLWIEEPTTITTKSMAAYMFWHQLATISGLYCRLGTGSFVAYTNVGAVNCGSNACMVRNDSAFSLARGKNTITADVYKTDTTDMGAQLSGYVLVNYTSGKASGGVGTHNRTVIWGLKPMGTSAAAVRSDASATAMTIPESSYYLSSVGTETFWTPSGTSAAPGCNVYVERLSSGSEGGIKWEPVFLGAGSGDMETGIYHAYADASRFFKRYPTDPDTPARFDIETARRWRHSTSQGVSSMSSIYGIFTYHSITFTVSGTVSGSGSGTVYADLIDHTNKLVLASTSRSGNGAVSFTWYDSVSSTLAVVYYEDSTHTGRSANGSAS